MLFSISRLFCIGRRKCWHVSAKCHSFTPCFPRYPMISHLNSLLVTLAICFASFLPKTWQKKPKSCTMTGKHTVRKFGVDSNQEQLTRRPCSCNLDQYLLRIISICCSLIANNIQKSQNAAYNERLKRMQLAKNRKFRLLRLLKRATIWTVMGAIGAAVLAIYIPALGWGSVSGEGSGDL